MFEYRESGNYNDQIMRVVNHALEVIARQTEEAQEESLNMSIGGSLPDPMTNHHDFEHYMTQLFDMVYED